MKKMMKKVLALFLVAALTVPYISTVSTTTVYASEYGDVDESGAVDAADALTVLKHVVKLVTLPENLQEMADVNLDGEVTAADALDILKYVVKLIPSLPVGGPIITPKDNLQTIQDYVIANGEVDETGIHYIYDMYEVQDGTVLYQMIMEIAYEAETEELVFGNTMICFDSATGEYYVELVEMNTDGTNSNGIYILSSLDEQGEPVSDFVLGTYLINSQVTEESAFAYETLYPEGEDLVAEGMNVMADTGMHLALYNWNLLLGSQFDMTLSDIGFTAY